LIPVLRSGLEAADLWATDISEAAEFLRAKNKDLGKFLVNEVATMSLPGGRVTQVNVTDVKDVVTPPVADRKARSDRSVSFSGSLSVLLEDRTDLYTLSSAAPSGYISYGSSAIVEATVEAVVLWDDGYRELKGARLVSATVHRWPVVRESTGGVP
jgi:hypothetical protein